MLAWFAALYLNRRLLQCLHGLSSQAAGGAIIRGFLDGVTILADKQPIIIQLYAGTRPDGEPVVEKVAVRENDDGSYLMLHSPAFVRGLARGDSLEWVSQRAGTFKVLKRAGNLAVRVYCKSDAEILDAALTPHVAQFEGRCDIKSEHLLVYSIPIEAGFDSVEEVFDQQLSGSADASWSYGNVYDEHSGEPLQWWQQQPDPNEIHLKRS